MDYQIDYWQELKEVSLFLHCACGHHLILIEQRDKKEDFLHCSEIRFRGITLTKTWAHGREFAFQESVRNLQRLPIHYLKDIAGLPERKNGTGI